MKLPFTTVCRKRHEFRSHWYKWFAWYPISVAKEDWRWLEVVERQLIPWEVYETTMFEHRIPIANEKDLDHAEK